MGIMKKNVVYPIGKFCNTNTRFGVMATTKLNENNLYRRMSTEEKKKLSAALTSLSPEDLDKALLIVSQDYPSFHATSQEVDLDIDSLVLFVRFNI